MPRMPAFAPLLVAWPSEFVLYEDAGTIAVSKPHGMIVHGGADASGGDVVTRLDERSAEARSRWRPCLAVDRRASGVLLLARDSSCQRQLTALASSGATDWRYLAAVRDPGLPAAGVVPAGSLDGRSTSVRFRIVDRGRGRALIQLETNAAPPHRVCERLARMGAHVVGDTGGDPSHRLMLHVLSLRVRGLPEFVAPMPDALRQAVTGADDQLPDERACRLLLLEAGWKRRVLADRCSVYRLANDLGDGLAGVSVDRYADWAVLSLSSTQALAQQRALAEALLALGARGVYVKRRVRADLRRASHDALAPELPVVGEPAPDRVVVHEGALRYVVRLGGALATGLYPDQRDNRRRLLEVGRDARVLNLFAYTGSFSVAAAIAGARSVTSVDLSARALAWARENFAENQLDPSAYRFVRADAMRWPSDADVAPYDLVVIDPPSFSTSGRRQVLRLSDRYVELVAQALSRLAPRGRLLAVTHQRSASQGAFRGMLLEASRRARRRIVQMRDAGAQLDCPAHGAGPSPSRSVWVTLS
ncbi:MAG: class I SAM-dependent methyltransferase [Polyangiaceae bacterium]|nr:class I SAM-dependent methyltransferase [Polyangiaceae bacterium]